MNQPEIRELECFVAVAEELSFSKAARRIHLSQPPLSRHIRNLEDKLGVQLLKRSTRRVELTAAGTLFLEDIRSVLRQINRATDSLRQAGSGPLSRLDIGFVAYLLESGMMRHLQRLRENRPECRIRLYDRTAPDLIEAVRSNEIDGAFIGTIPKKLPGTIQAVIWERAALRIAISKYHPLAAQKKLSIRDLKNESWIMIARKAAPAFHDIFLQLCTNEGFRPKITYESESPHVISAMVAVGEGISLVTETPLERSFSDLRCIPLDGPQSILNYGFIFRADRNSAPLRALVEIVKIIHSASNGKRIVRNI